MFAIDKLLGVLLLIAFSYSFASSISADTAISKPKSLQFQSAKTCQQCHQLIYDEWRQSWMAHAFTNSVFQTDLKRFQELAKDTGDSALRCMRCHAPAALMTSDNDSRQLLSEEGVTCEICHKVAKVKKREVQYHLILDPENTQYGVNQNKSESFHAVKYSMALDDSSLCAGCHYDIPEPQLPLERTYQEWANSDYAKEGVQCRTCHMPQASGSATLEPGKAIPASRKQTHASHQFPGGHADSVLLKEAAGLSIKYDKNKQSLIVQVSNQRVGHNFPTGGAHPSQLLLEISLFDSEDKIVRKFQRQYQLKFPDKNITTHSTSRDSTQLIRDSTLKPRETRDEVFDLTGIPFFKMVDAVLIYKLLPEEEATKFDPGLQKSSYRPVEISRCVLNINKNSTLMPCSMWISR